MIHLDTHIAVWLYHADKKRFSAKARRALAREEVLISPVVKLELQYLHEIGRIAVPAQDVIRGLIQAAGIGIARCELDTLIEAALDEQWTRDPFDRLIVAQARQQRAPLISADDTIARHYAGCVW